MTAARLATALVAAAILVVSLIPNPPGMDRPGRDKVAHAAAYALLGFVCLLGTGGWRAGVRAALLVIALCTAYGGLIEIIQPLAGRSRELADVAADFAGSSLGAAAAALVGTGRHGDADRRGRPL